MAKKNAPKSIPFKPNGNRIAVEPLNAEDVSAGGIHIPDTAREKPTRGVVVAVGEGKLDDELNVHCPPPFEVGQTVLYSRYGISTFKLEGTEYVVLDADEVLGIFEEK